MATKLCSINEASELLKSSKLVAIPTETVYGLAANALDPIAISKIFIAKNRPAFNPLIVHLGDYRELHKYVQITPLIEKLANFWPGPLTILIKHNGKIPAIVTADSELCAFRIPDHPIAIRLLQQCELPLAAPSANLSNLRSPTNMQMVLDQLDGKIDGILDGGQCRLGVESTVVEPISEDEIIIHRPGGIIKDDFLALNIKVKEPKAETQNNQTQTTPINSPGQLSSHYTPKQPLILLDPFTAKNNDSLKQSDLNINIKNIEKLKLYLQQMGLKKITLLTYHTMLPILDGLDIFARFNLSKDGKILEAASNLFLYFDLIAKSDSDVIISCLLPQKGLGVAINDRLTRAASHTIL